MELHLLMGPKSYRKDGPTRLVAYMGAAPASLSVVLLIVFRVPSVLPPALVHADLLSEPGALPWVLWQCLRQCISVLGSRLETPAELDIAPLQRIDSR